MPEFRTLRFQLNESESVELLAKPIASATTYKLGKDRWTELSVHVTPTRLYIVQSKGRSSAPGERTIHSTAMVTSERDIAKFLGTGPLAAKILATLNIK